MLQRAAGIAVTHTLRLEQLCYMAEHTRVQAVVKVNLYSYIIYTSATHRIKYKLICLILVAICMLFFMSYHPRFSPLGYTRLG